MKQFAATQLDFYKTGHKDQYPKGTEYVYSNLTARSGNLSNVPDSKGVYFVGLQLFIKDFLIDQWNDTFFNRPKEEVLNKYHKRVSSGLEGSVSTDHLAALHDLGYLPIRIKALPEGSFVPYKVPLLTIVNTLPEFFWLTNALESVLSAELWQMINSATTYKEYERVFLKYSNKTCEDNSLVPFQGHDFSFRGMPGREAAAKSAFAALSMGAQGTDTVGALDIAEDYYLSTRKVAGSVNATEHSVMCAGSKAKEAETFTRLLTEVYPTGTISIVSDTWDFWKVITETLPKLKSLIMHRMGKLVIRPDSGDPVAIICGTSTTKGLIAHLWDIFGGEINNKGYKVLDSHIGAIYGDSITLSRQSEILRRLEEDGFASSNIILGIGSYTYQMTTRDTHGLAVKATWAKINGVGKELFKDPKTDNGVKKSAKGLLSVYWENGKYVIHDQMTKKQEARGVLDTVFLDGVLIKEYTFDQVCNNSKFT